jgi:hypothetical protein
VQTAKIERRGRFEIPPGRTKGNFPANKNFRKLLGDRSQRVRLIDG